MAEVHEAFDMENDRKVALKLLPGGQFDNAVVAEIFRRETRALRELKHENIVELLDSGIDAATGYPYLILEWVPHDLSFVIDRGPFAGWDEFYESAGRGILEAIAFSHSRQIAHRDIKLKNVLIDEGRSPKLADFGIAKLRTDITPGVTLREFVTRPYAPPEPDEGMFAYARDVYGFGVLALRCLLPRELRSYEDVYAGLEEVDLPSEIYTILATTLDRDDPSRRPLNGEVLIDRIERVQRARQRAWQVRPCVILALTRKSGDALRREWPGKSDSELESVVKTDLETFAVEPYKASVGTNQFLLIGGRCWYHVTVATDEDHLVILNAGSEDELRLERRRDFAATPEIEFRFGAIRDIAGAKKNVLSFLSATADYKREADARQKVTAEDALLGTWDRILSAKEDLERRRETPIPFEGVERDGNRLRIHPTGEVDEASVGQFRQIRTGDVIHVQGEIESVSPEEVVLYISVEYGSVPRRGTLVIDVAQSKRALQRQRAALDAVRFNRAVRSDLRQLLVNPASAAEPVSVVVDSFVQELDDSKKDAVRAALAAEDFLIVEGPPGTGKTTFITELILQTLQRNPDSRILLASQTHVALDNALEGVRHADTGLRLVRVGRPSDSKISASVADLLLDNQMPVWRRTSLAQADDFLRSRAESLGVSLDNLFIARRLSDVHRVRTRRCELDAELEEIQRRLAEWHRDRPEDRASAAEGTVPVEVAELQDGEASIKKELKDLRSAEEEATEELVRRDPDLEEILADEATDLAGWEATFRPASTNSANLDRLIGIRAEWDLRFGKGREFQSALIASAQVVAGTCVGLAAIRGIQEITFDLCIIDEASKANATEALVPMAMATRWVLVGDERQLPPFVEDELTNRDFQSSYTPVQNRFEPRGMKYRRVPVESGCRSSRHGGARRCSDSVAFSIRFSSLFLVRSFNSSPTGTVRIDARRGSVLGRSSLLSKLAS
jgi:serine/threonine protein kinase